jgi:hypothetical protein
MTNAKAKKVNASAEVAKAATAKPEVTLLFNESELYKTEAAIKKAVDVMTKTTADINKEYQKIALSLLSHAMQHGDVTVIERGINYMFDAFSKGMRKDSMCAWFDKYGCVTFEKQELKDSNGKDISKLVAVYSKEKREKMKKEGWYLQAASNWWYNAAKQTEYVPFNLDEYLIKVAGYLQKKAKSPKEGDIIDSVAIESVVNAINQTVSKHKEQVAVAA